MNRIQEYFERGYDMERENPRMVLHHVILFLSIVLKKCSL